MENGIETTFVTCIILFIDPFHDFEFLKLLAGALIVFVARVSYEVFLTRPFTKFMRNVKKRIFATKPKNEIEDKTGGK
jgi:hypothetical protein